jgi:hypothetical protein
MSAELVAVCHDCISFSTAAVGIIARLLMVTLGSTALRIMVRTVGGETPSLSATWRTRIRSAMVVDLSAVGAHVPVVLEHDGRIWPPRLAWV